MSSRRWKIVIVEDHDPDVFLIKEALTSHGIEYDLTHFNDSEQAVLRLCTAPEEELCEVPDLILLDLNMPRLPGIEVLKCIRETKRLAHVPVAILTSSYSPNDLQETALAGATIYIRKRPILDDFLNAVGSTVSELLNGTGRT
jgi:two-component system, chemotaxis family, response regulator Rcp1